MPITDDRTAHLNLPKPYADNMLEDDSTRIRTAFDGFDTAIYGKQAVIGYTPENAAMKGVANGYASLGSDSKVPAGQLPSFVDDVLEYATFGGLPGTGEAGKIYVVIATNKTYRWSGSVYTEIASSPGSTDVVSEGAVNLYHTDARALAAVPIASPSVLGKVKVGAGLGIDGAGLLFASAGGGSVMTMVDVVPGSNGVSSITVPAGYVVGAILVAFNGALLSPSDFTATTGTTIGLVGFTAGTVDTFTIISLATVSIGTLPASSVGTTQLAAGAVTLAKTTGLAASGANTDITSLAGPGLGAATATTPGGGDNDTSVATTAFVQGELSSQAVKLTGAQTIAGVKTLSNTPVLSNGATFGSATMANPSGSAPLAQARAWANFNGQTVGANAPIAGMNIASITRNASGDYTVNFSTAMPDANYAVVITGMTDTGGAGAGGFNAGLYYNSLTTTSFRFKTAQATGASFTDVIIGSIVVFR